MELQQKMYQAMLDHTPWVGGFDRAAIECAKIAIQAQIDLLKSMTPDFIQKKHIKDSIQELEQKLKSLDNGTDN
jgi:hypothetical protein